MITKTYKTKEEWFEARLGCIGGSRLGDITPKRGGGYKKGFYELIAEKVAIPDTEDVPTNPMERGCYLEKFNLDRFESETGKKVNKGFVIWSREDNPNISYSPDGTIGNTKKIKEVVECKSLSSASHLEAWLTKKIPSEYDEQVIQAFIVNEDLERTYFCFLDPRIPAKDFFYFVVERKDIEDKIEEYLEMEKKILNEIDLIVAELIF